MKIRAIGDVSDEFLYAVDAALQTFPRYIREAKTEIRLGKTIFDIAPDLRESDYPWESTPLCYSPSENRIALAEYYIAYESRETRKYQDFKAGIAHEAGHYFDDRVFGLKKGRIGYFSTSRNGPFRKAWKADVGKLNTNPSLTEGLSDQFERHTAVKNGFGLRETFAELWANAHGQSALSHEGIDTIEPYFPRCAKVIQNCISKLEQR